MESKSVNVIAMLAEKFKLKNKVMADLLFTDPSRISDMRRGKKKIALDASELYKTYFESLPEDKNMSEDMVLDICKSYLKEHELNFSVIDEYRNKSYSDAIIGMINFGFQSTPHEQPLERRVDANELVQYLPELQSGFLGREDLLESIEAKMKKFGSVAICGIGGIGKSTIAKRYAFNHKEKYSKIQYLQFEESIRTTIETELKFTSIDEDKVNRKVLFEKKIDELMKLDESKLIIIDNMDVKEFDEDLSKLLGCSANLLITTRNKMLLGEEHNVLVDSLNKDNQIQLFENHVKCKVRPREMKTVEAILEMVGGHTLGIEIIGKTIYNGDYTYEEIYDCLNENDGFDLEDEVKIFKDSTAVINTMGRILMTLYDISNFTDEEISVMANLMLLPIETVNRRNFKSWCGLKSNNNVNNLIDNSWVKKSEERNPKIWLHPLISDVCREKGIATLERCSTFFAMVKTKLSEKGLDFETMRVLSQIASKALSNIIPSNESEIDELLMLSEIILKNQSYSLLLNAFNKIEWNDNGLMSLEQQKRLFGIRAKAYMRIADYNRAIQSYEELIALESNQESLKVAELFKDIAFVYRKDAKYEVAAEYYEKSLAIQNEIADNDSLFLATTYNDYALVYLNQKDFQEAEKINNKALAIRVSNKDVKWKDLAYSYNNIGTVYREQKRYEEAVTMHMKALEIRLENLNPWDLDIASSYSNIGVDMEEAGRLDEAGLYYDKAREIREKMCSENHPDLAWMYNSLGSLALKRKEVDTAIEFLKKSHGIRLESVGKYHPYVAVTLLKLGEAYMLANQRRKALSCIEQAYLIQKSIFDENSELVKETLELKCNIERSMTDE